jgi:hypothetical protein
MDYNVLVQYCKYIKNKNREECYCSSRYRKAGLKSFNNTQPGCNIAVVELVIRTFKFGFS